VKLNVKCEVVHLRRNNTVNPYRLGTDGPRGGFAQKDWGLWLKLIWIWTSSVLSLSINLVLCYTGSVASRSREIIVLL